MLFRILRKSLRLRKARVLVAVVAVMMGTSLASAFLNLTWDISEKVGRELRSYGANILVTPKSESLRVEIGGVSFGELSPEDYLNESDLGRLKTIFWRNNILGIAPFLYSVVGVDTQQVILAGTWFEKVMQVPTGGFFITGVKAMFPFWALQGSWISDDNGTSNESIVGTKLASILNLTLGNTLSVMYKDVPRAFSVVGIVSTGGFEDEQVFVKLSTQQEILNLSGRVEKVLVSALVQPDDDFARKDPKTMTPTEFQRWYCSAYLNSILFQIEEVLPGARPKAILQVAQVEGVLLSQMQSMFLLITILALVASALGMMGTMTISVLEREPEIGLMRALGASRGHVEMQFLAEGAIFGILGGVAGFFIGLGLAQFIGLTVFGTLVAPGFTIMPLALSIAVGVALLGSSLPARNAARIHPAIVMRGG